MVLVLEKDCLYPGVVQPPDLDEPVRFLPEDVRYYTERLRDMLKDGLQVPVTWEHQESMEQPLTREERAQLRADLVKLTCGYAVDCSLDPDLGCLQVKSEFDDPEDARRAKSVRYVSPAIRWNVKDGRNKVWDGPSIVALACTNRPVQHRQNSWRSVNLSLLAEKGGALRLSLPFDYVEFGDVRLARKPPDAVAYSAEDSDLGDDAKRQKTLHGRNPPNWAVDEAKWEEAKKAAKKTYSEDDKAFWAVVTSIYRNMGGKINKGADMSIRLAESDPPPVERNNPPPPKEGEVKEGQRPEKHDDVARLIEALSKFEIPVVLGDDTDKGNIVDRLVTALTAITASRNPPANPGATVTTPAQQTQQAAQQPREATQGTGYLMSLEEKKKFEDGLTRLSLLETENKTLKDQMAAERAKAAEDKRKARRDDLDRRLNALLTVAGKGRVEPLQNELKAVNLSQEADPDRKLDIVEAKVSVLESLKGDADKDASLRFGLKGGEPREVKDENAKKKEPDPHVMNRLTRGAYDGYKEKHKAKS